jgi:DsbC/DsbD-like thiol-disulfide interchange protein
MLRVRKVGVMRIWITCAIGCLLGLAHSARAAAPVPPPAEELVKAQLLADTTAVQPGQPFRVGVLLKIAPLWHVYWENAGAGGVPTTVNIRLPEGFTASSIQYPVPRTLSLQGGLLAYGYEDEVMLIATITPPARIESANITIGADSNWLVCEKVCLSGDASLSLTIPVSQSKQSDHQELFNQWSAKLPVPINESKQIASYRQDSRPGAISIQIEWKGQLPNDIEWFPPASDAWSFSNARVETKGSTTTITSTMEQLPGQKAPETPLKSVVGYNTASGRRGIAVPVKLKDPMKPKDKE